jgi:AcrR family transcriptional regulator
MGKRKSRAPSVRSPRQPRGVDTVRFILDAVDRLLREEGAAAVTTKRVARVAGVGIGTVYQYFPDRTALLREVERRAWATELQLLVARLPEIREETLPQTILEVVRFTIDGIAKRVATHGLTLDDHELRKAGFALLEQAEEFVVLALGPAKRGSAPTRASRSGSRWKPSSCSPGWRRCGTKRPCARTSCTAKSVT